MGAGRKAPRAGGGRAAQRAGAKQAWRAEIRATLALAWPVALAQVGQIAINTTDVVMIGRLGPEELAASDGDALSVFFKSLAHHSGPPPFDPPPITLDALLAQGRRLVAEQEAVNQHRLADEYMNGGTKKSAGPSLIGLSG